MFHINKPYFIPYFVNESVTTNLFYQLEGKEERTGHLQARVILHTFFYYGECEKRCTDNVRIDITSGCDNQKLHSFISVPYFPNVITTNIITERDSLQVCRGSNNKTYFQQEKVVIQRNKGYSECYRRECNLGMMNIISKWPIPSKPPCVLDNDKFSSFQVDKTCYFFPLRGSSMFSWMSAKDACAAKGASLAMFHSLAVLEQVKYVISRLLLNINGTVALYFGLCCMVSIKTLGSPPMFIQYPCFLNVFYLI